MDKYISGVLLSAGKSERMGEMKALLSLNNKLVIEKLIEEYLDTPIDELIVVVGFNGQKLESIIKSLFQTDKLKVVYNEKYEEGMFSSVVKGVESATFDNVLLGLVDNPLINSDIIKRLLNEFDFEHIVIPSYNKKGGHPVLFPKFVKDAILSGKYETLKEVFDSFKEKVDYVDAPIEVAIDMDTKEDYEKILRFLEGGSYD
ncbi:MAG: nucleotidyltransferase family protein [Caldisericum exile]|uniref:nucleotidyltransferase family protein n=1 Tax=Caldisericum exile TaxID=693075 RepID=UPI003C715780